VNNIPVDLCTQKGIVVFNTPGANANAVKELVIAGMLISSRRVCQGINWTQSLKGKGAEVPALVEKGKADFTGPEILGKKLAVIGLGAIGVIAANAATDLGMEVIGFDPHISVESAWGLSRSVKRAKSLEGALMDADYITVHVPLLPETKGVINAALLSKMKNGVRIMNFARGELVNNKDMLAAIKDGKVACYVTDFPEEELLGIDQVIPVPHLGASTPEAEDNCAIMAAEQLKSFLETGNIKNSVNFPNCELDFMRKTRIVLANKNVPNMVGQITTVLANEGLNIAEMLNKGKGEVAYNIIDLDNDVSQKAVDKLKAIEGVIMVRVIKA
jgi:D-3-phosphoglycerate dehydrogenase